MFKKVQKYNVTPVNKHNKGTNIKALLKFSKLVVSALPHFDLIILFNLYFKTLKKKSQFSGKTLATK